MLKDLLCKVAIRSLRFISRNRAIAPENSASRSISTIPSERIALSLFQENAIGTIVKICDSRRYCRVSSNVGVRIDKFNQGLQRCYFFSVFLVLHE